jgi:uncharacterized protein
MSITLSNVTRTAIDQMYTGLDGVLKKGAAHAKEKGVDEAVFLNWRLASDMLPMKFQVQVAAELPARGLSRLAGVEVPSLGEIGDTFEGLHAHLKKSRGFISDLSDDAINADPDGDVTVPVGPEQKTFKRAVFIQNFIIPNLYFHVTASYLILRHLGVELGKTDFLAAQE